MKKFYNNEESLKQLARLAKDFYLEELKKGKIFNEEHVGIFENGLTLYIGFKKYHGDVYDDVQVLFDSTGKFKLRDSNGFMVYAYTVKDE
ncbi:hypothetical protein [Sphingobacterium multivorum]|uniref:hypothetical protein n=1 Tax=Sphingobacterium multivorum TaxID=28454 RepID=UPI002896D80D|nr:hypothetical protein [Sphingobacterium multivorum]